METSVDARGDAVQGYVDLLTNEGFKRCVSYAARAYERQNRRDEEYDVPPVYLIGIMGTDISHTDPNQLVEQSMLEYTFREKTTGEVLDNTIFIIFAHQKERCSSG